MAGLFSGGCDKYCSSCTSPTAPTQSVPAPVLVTATMTATATATASATCPNGTTATATASSTATATATASTIEEARAIALAQATTQAQANAHAQATANVVCGAIPPTPIPPTPIPPTPIPPIPPTPCAYMATPTFRHFGFQASWDEVRVSTESNCGWTAVSNSSWITITGGSSGNSNGVVSYAVTQNTGSFRTGTILVAGRIVTIEQEAAPVVTPCTYVVSPTSQNFAYTGGNGGVSVSTQSGCSWTAVSNASWITITGGASGVGNGSVSYSVVANTGVARTGTMTIGGQTVTVTEEAVPVSTCTFAVQETPQNFTYQGGNGGFSVSASASTCSWTATSNVTWIAITSGASGTGSNSVAYIVAGNGGGVRTGTISVAGKTVTIVQGAQ